MIETIIGVALPKLIELFGGIFGVDLNSEENRAKKMELAAKAQSILMGCPELQIQVNQEEAKNPSVFVAGWRPFIGWVCGVGLLWSCVLLHLGNFISAQFGGPVLPPVDISTLLTVLLGMLGMGGLRTYEKLVGTARDDLKTPLSMRKS